MADSFLSNVTGFDTERSVTAPFTGSDQNLGTALTHNPVIMIFDNQSDVAVQLKVNGNVWKTFAAGSALVLDMRANHGIAATYTPVLGTQLVVNATGGTIGGFYLSITYAQ